MLSYITVGANDVLRSEAFYAAILPPLGYEKKGGAGGIEFAFPAAAGGGQGPAVIYVMKPHDGKAATAGNGSMAAFQALSQAMVRDLHAAGLKAGGSDEGRPGFREEYSASFYVGYLRDPVGNKVAIFCSDPAEGTRDG